MELSPAFSALHATIAPFHLYGAPRRYQKDPRSLRDLCMAAMRFPSSTA